LTDFSDIVHASRYIHIFAFAPAAWRDWNHCAAADGCPAPAEQSIAYSCRPATRSQGRERTAKRHFRRPKMEQATKKEPP
jgi:hypothetical protein